MNEIDTTRERLLAGALTCVRSKGLTATTSRDIAAASGVNLAGITYHFGSKDALIAEALLSAVRRWLAPARAVLAAGGDAATRATATVAALTASLDEAREWLPVYLEALVHARHHDALGAALGDLRSELHGLLAADIEQFQARGALPAWVQPPVMASLLVAMADGIAVHVALDPHADHRAVTAHALQLLLAAAP
ncbi:MAG: TetR family transcriptional regulator C-terminal domain-containing protein [Actinobacteria bacterium]|nr:TetR family transcriptional regulator C-terminal domain-containing protein [Actinomycetota bacterium]